MDSLVRILQISDPHLAGDAPLPGVDGDERLVHLFAEIIDRRLSIDACIITGDLAHKGNRASYERLRRLLNSCPWPTRVLPGNHDAIQIGREALGRGYWPPADVWSWRISGKVTVIGFSSVVEGFHHGELSDESVRRLRALAVDAAEAGPWLIACHHPPLDVGHWWMDGQSLLRNAEALLQIADKHGAMAIICGHLHMDVSALRAGKTPVLVAPSTAHEVVYDDGVERPLRFRAGTPRAMLHAVGLESITSVTITTGGRSWLVDGYPWTDEVSRTNDRRPSPH